MTKDSNILPMNMEMNGNKVSRSNRRWQGHAEMDMIAPCKEKLQLLLSCCQDVTHLVETLEAQMQLSSRPNEAPMMLDADETKMEIILLRDELCRSKLHNEELEIAKMSLEKEMSEMEEKVQALTAQLLVYKEDFDLEREDRERAQGRLLEFEQQLLAYQRPYESHQSRPTLEPCAANAQSSVPRRHHHHHHHCLSNELVPRGLDVCDFYQTDGVEGDDRTIEEKRSAMPYTTTEAIEGQYFRLESDSCPSVELKAQSFNILDFFPVTTAHAEKSTDAAVSAKSFSVGHEVVVEGATERDTLCTDGVEPPLSHATAVLTRGGLPAASPPNKPLVDQCKSQQQDLYDPNSWSFLSEDQPAAMNLNLNLYQTDSSRLFSTKSLEDDSQLMCPKCRMRFSCSDHLLLLDHLEEC